MSSGKEERILEIIKAMEELREDSTVPRNVKTKLEASIGVLKNEGNEMRLRIDKVLQELDEVANDTNAQSYTRSQIWNIVSMLESVQN